MAREPWQDFYNAQSGEHGDGYAGDLNKGNEKEYEEGDSKVDASRKDFAKPAGPCPAAE